MIKAVIFDFFGVLEQEWLPNYPLLDFIKRELKPKYKLAIISNAVGDFAYEIMSADQLGMFDEIVISYKAGVAKPHPDIYDIALKSLQVKPQETIFVDDTESFCQAARALGMKTILYKDFLQTKTDLKKMLAEQ